MDHGYRQTKQQWRRLQRRTTEAVGPKRCEMQLDKTNVDLVKVVERLMARTRSEWDALLQPELDGYRAEYGLGFRHGLRWLWDDNSLEEIKAFGLYLYNKEAGEAGPDEKSIHGVPSEGPSRRKPFLSSTYIAAWAFLSPPQLAALCKAHSVRGSLWEKRYSATEMEWTDYVTKLGRAKGKFRLYSVDAHWVEGRNPAELKLDKGATQWESALSFAGARELLMSCQKSFAEDSHQTQRTLKETQRNVEFHNLAPPLPGAGHANLPESLRVLYGTSPEIAKRLDSFLERVQTADTYLQSHRFNVCDYCLEGWFGTDLPCPLEEEPHMNFRMAPEGATADRPVQNNICLQCWSEACGLGQARLLQSAARKDPPAWIKEPTFWTHANDMSIGQTYPALDALTYFEEQLLAPVQPLVRIFTLYSTGLTEMRGHVANWHQNGPQWVREIPVRARDAGILLIRRFPKDPQRKQRLPFVVSRRRLEAALAQLCQPRENGGHLAFQRGALTRDGIKINHNNLDEYSQDGAEPDDLEVATVDQIEKLCVDRSLFERWLAPALELQTNTLLRLHLPTKSEDQTDAEWYDAVWKTWNREVRAAQPTPDTNKNDDDLDDKSSDSEGAGDPITASCLTDTAIANWITYAGLLPSTEDALNTLRDELTVVHEQTAWANLAEQSGTILAALSNN